MHRPLMEALGAQFQEQLEGRSSIEEQLRERAWKALIERGLPDKKDSGYQYFPLTHFYADSFAPEIDFVENSSVIDLDGLILPECSANCLVFVDGRYIKEYSSLSEGLVFLELSKALKTYGSFLQPYVKQQIDKEKDFFALASRSVSQGAYFLYVPPQMKVTPPLQVLHLVSSEKRGVRGMTIQVVMGKKSSLTLFSQTELMSGTTEGRGVFSHELFDFFIDEESTVHEYSLHGASHLAWRSRTTRASLKEKGQFHQLSLCMGARGSKRDFAIDLLGKESLCRLEGVSALSESLQSHVNIAMKHHAPGAESMQKFKQIVGGKGRASFEGKIYVHPEAQQTQAYQLCQSLLLSDQAMVYCKPNLEIFADDVKASHGATVTQMDEDQLLYLRMRGLKELEAKELLLASFWLELLDKIPSEELALRAKKMLSEKRRNWE